MPTDHLGTLLAVLEDFRPAFTATSFTLFLILVRGWFQTLGRHTITEALVETGLSAQRDWSAFYRFFSRGVWEPDALGRCLLPRVLRWIGEGLPILLVIDDTLCPHKGPYIFGLGCHIDAVRSSRLTKIFAFGHVWVTLAVVVPVPFSRRWVALPLLARLYRQEAACRAAGVPFHTKTALARAMLAVFDGWLAAGRAADEPPRPLLLAIDCGYANHTVLGDLPAHLDVLGAMRPDAALRTLDGRKVSPRDVADDSTQPWQTTVATLYGEARAVPTKTLWATWPRVCGTQVLRIVIVRCDTGTLPLRIFFCTEVAAGVRAVLEAYADGRWPTEVLYRDVKQFLGLSDAGVRVEAAVRRVAPFVFLLVTVTVLWALEVGVTPTTIVQTERRWYRHKASVSFLDLLRTLRKSLTQGDLSALAAAHEAEARAQGHPLPAATPRRKQAA